MKENLSDIPSNAFDMYLSCFEAIVLHKELFLNESKNGYAIEKIQLIYTNISF